MQALRTPDERFADLPGWPYEPKYLSDLAGANEWPMPEFDGDLPATRFIAHICQTRPDLAAVLSEQQNRICVNHEIHPAAATLRISSEDEVAFIPPMSGG